MKKLILFFTLISGIVFNSCSSDDDYSCFQTWNVDEYWIAPHGCNVFGADSPDNNKRFNCDEVKDIKEGDVILEETVECAKHYIRFNHRVK